MAELKIIRMSDISSEPVSWLWEPYLPRGVISLIQGDGGQGKTTMSLAIAAAITNGELLLGQHKKFAPGNVIIQNAEDSYAKTIKPRLAQFGADCERVFTIDENELALSYSDERIEHTIKRTNAKLFLLDPLQAYFGSANMNAANSVRPLMKNLGTIAEQTGCAIVLVGHLGKKGGKSQYRGLGSIDIFAASRSVITVGSTDVDDTIRAMVHNKSNLASAGASLAFGLDPVSGFCWLGEYDITIDELLDGKKAAKQEKPQNQFAKARLFIENILKDGAVPTVEIMQMAEDEGISERTLHRAKSALGVVSVKCNGKWHWEIAVEVEYAVVDDEPCQNSQGCQPCHESALATLADMATFTDDSAVV
jgi:hypothetical protein